VSDLEFKNDTKNMTRRWINKSGHEDMTAKIKKRVKLGRRMELQVGRGGDESLLGARLLRFRSVTVQVPAV